MCSVRILNEEGKELPAGAVGEIAVRSPYLMKGYHKGGSDEMDLIFKEKVAVITGAGNGLGRCYALELAWRGAKEVSMLCQQKRMIESGEWLCEDKPFPSAPAYRGNRRIL